MNISVLKFGGTSVGTADMIRHAGDRVEEALNDDERVAVVVSAATPRKGEGTTDYLVQMATSIKQEGFGSDDIPKLRDVLLKTHHDILSGLGLSARLLDKPAARLKKIITGNNSDLVSPEFTYNKAELLAWGEETMFPIVAAHLRERGIRSRGLDAREIIAMEHRRGEVVQAVKIPQTLTSVRRELSRMFDHHEVPVIPGFYGQTDGPVPHTMLHSRGGSDYSAALVAAGIQASRLDICTDVPGVFRALPDDIVNTPVIPQLSYREMLAYASRGAKVVHKQAIGPIWRGNRHGPIPMRIVETRSGRSATTINSHAECSPKAIASGEDCPLLRVIDPAMDDADDVLSAVSSILSRHHYVVGVLGSEDDTIAMTVNGIIEDDVLNEIREQFPWCVIEVENNCAAIVLIGHEIRRNTKAINTLMNASSSCRLASTEGPDSFTVVVPFREKARLLQQVYADIFLP